MLRKQFNCVLSVFLVILCVTAIRCDVSHLIGAESPVDAGTMEILKQNISDYLVQLASGGSPQMQLQHIYSASKQIVTGTLYTVQAQLATPDGAKNCEIRVLEKPWIEFCQVRVSCENGGHYEVTFNSHQSSHDISQHLSAATYLPPPLPPTTSPAPIYHYQPPVTVRPNPFIYKPPTTQAVKPQLPFNSLPKFEFKPTPQFHAQPTPAYHYQPQAPPKFEYKPPQPAPVYNFKPQATLPTAPVFHPQPQPVPVFQPQSPPKFEFKPPPPAPVKPAFEFTPPAAPVFHPQPQPVPVFQPQEPAKFVPPFDVRRDEPVQHVHHDFPIKNGVPKPLFPPPPELNVLSYDQVPPEGPQLQQYLHGLFDDFMVKYNRQYIDEPQEQEYRFNVFTNNFHLMHEHSRTDRLACQYSVTEFSDLTQDEFSRIMGFQTGADGLNGTDVSNADIPQTIGDLPEKYDQRDENIVTRVKFQGDCGACWAFVTTAVIEGLCAKKTKKLQEFSEQSLIDCDNSNFGCKGGVPPKAMKHIAQRGGLELESVYPFVFAKSTCKFEKKNVRVKVAGVVSFKKNDEEGMAKWLFKNGPILVGINAAPLQHYKSGVLNPTPELCSPKKINHGVTLIGFGVEVNTSTGEKLPYWIVKNQWGTRFGEDGYFRIARGKNACGIALWANSVRLANDPNNCLLEGV